jgi:superfamily I DNA and RNA helicase
MRDVLCRVKEGRNILLTVKGREANWVAISGLGTAFYKMLLKERSKEGKT